MSTGGTISNTGNNILGLKSYTKSSPRIESVQLRDRRPVSISGSHEFSVVILSVVVYSTEVVCSIRE